jgi:hypothetical protein
MSILTATRSESLIADWIVELKVKRMITIEKSIRFEQNYLKVKKRIFYNYI